MLFRSSTVCACVHSCVRVCALQSSKLLSDASPPKVKDYITPVHCFMMHLLPSLLMSPHKLCFNKSMFFNVFSRISNENIASLSESCRSLSLSLSVSLLLALSLSFPVSFSLSLFFYLNNSSTFGSTKSIGTGAAVAQGVERVIC